MLRKQVVPIILKAVGKWKSSQQMRALFLMALLKVIADFCMLIGANPPGAEINIQD